MKRLNVALLAGGNSSEREVSINSAAQVGAAFNSEKYNIFTIDVNGRIWQHRDAQGVSHDVDKNDFSITINGEKTALEYAFIMIHGTPGEDGMMQGYLDMMGIPYSSCDRTSSALTFDKRLCKLAVAGIEGLSLAKEVVVKKGENIDPRKIAAELGLPLFVKPNASGSSCGVSKVKSEAEIAAAIEKAFAESDAVLIEEFIAGREFGCGVVVTKEQEYRLPVTEIISKNDFFDYEAKYTSGCSDEITPADIPEELSLRLQELAVRIYRACDCRGLVRIDFMVTSDGRPYMIEANTIPGMSSGSIVPKQLVSAGIGMGEMIDIIIADTLV